MGFVCFSTQILRLHAFLASQPEIELRACALVACHRLAELARSRGIHMIEADLDYYLWLLGKRDSYRGIERHYCPGTPYY